MADINLNIVGTADFNQINSAVRRLQAQLAQLQAQYNTTGSTQLFKGIKTAVGDFNEYVEASGKFRVHTVNATSAAAQLGERIRRNNTTFSDFRMAMSKLNTEGSLFLELGKKQIAMQEATAITVGKTTHVYENLALNFTKTTLAARANAAAIAAQNAVLREQAVQIVNWGKNMQWTGRQLTMGITMPIVMFGAQSAKIFNEVDKNLTRLAKVYGVGLTEPTQRALKAIRKDVLDLSTELGKSLGIASSEVTDIAAQFAAAGLQGKELLNATKQASRIVVLGEADKQEAINATISLQTAYKLSTNEVTEAVNFFNAAQAATSTSMGDLINAIPRVGPIVKGLGGTYKDMVAILTALKEGGVPAGEAANAIKNSLGRIINPTETAKKSLKNFGIDIEKIVNVNAGNLVGTITALQEGLLNLDSLSRQKAISEIFGKYQFARMSAFIENFNTAGSQSAKIMQMMGMSTVDLANIADKQTKKLQESASGRFKIAVETMKNTLIPVGEKFLDIFTSILGKISEVVKSFQDLPGPVKSFLKLLGGLTAIVGPAVMIGGLIGNMVGSIALGLVKLKSFGGAIRSLFTGGGMSGFRTILSGFKDVDLVADAATKSVQLFNDQGKNTVSAAQVFESGIDRMVLSLKALSDQAINTRGSIDALTAPTAAAQQRAVNVTSEQKQTAYRQLMSQGVLFPTTDELGGQRSKVQASVGGLVQEFLPSSSMNRGEFFRSQAKAGGVTLPSEIQRLTQNESVMRGLVVTRDEYLKSIASYFASLQVAIGVDAKAWNAAQSKLKATITSTSTLSQREAAINEFRQAVGMQGEAFDSYVESQVQMLKGMTGKLSNQELLALTASQEASMLSQIQSRGRGFQGFSTEATVRGRSNAMQRLLYGIAGGGGGVSPQELVQHTYMDRSDVSGLEHSHLVPPKILMQQANEETRRLVEWWAKNTSQTLTQAAEQLMTGITPQNGTAGMFEYISKSGRKFYLDLTQGIQNVVAYELNEAGVLVKSSISKAALGNIARTKTVTKAVEDFKIAQTQLDAAVIRDLEQAAAAERMAAGVPSGTYGPLPQSGKWTSGGAEKASRSNIGGKLGTVGMMASMGLMTAGIGNETANSAAMGISMASMLPMLSSFAGLSVGPQAAIFAAVAALPLLIQGYSNLQKSADEYRKSVYAAFTTSTKEAEIFGIKLKELGDMTIPALTKAAKARQDEIDLLTKQIKSLAIDDPLSLLISKLKDQNLEERLKTLQLKYLTFRVQGLSNKEAQNNIQAITRAAGVEMSTMGDFKLRAGLYSGMSNAELFAQQQSEVMGSLRNATDFSLSGQTLQNNALIDTRYDYSADNIGNASRILLNTNNEITQQAIKESAKNLQNLVATGGNEFIQELGKYTEGLRKGSPELQLFNQSVKLMFKRAGGKDDYQELRDRGVAAADALTLFKLRLDGTITTVAQWQRALTDDTYRSQLVSSGQARASVSSAETTFAEAIAGMKGVKDTYTVGSDQNANYDKQIAAQQSIVDKLQEELNFRNKINDAQEKSLSYSNSQASLQQQYNEAISTNDLARAADLQRQMTEETSKYNAELKKTLQENKLEKENKKLEDLQSKKQKFNDNLSKSGVSLNKTLSEETQSIITQLEDAIQSKKGVTQGQINAWADSLKSQFGGSAKIAKDELIKLKSELESNPQFMLGKNIADAMGPALDATQQAIVRTQTFMNLQSGKYATIQEAMENALTQALGKSVTYREASKGYKAGYYAFTETGKTGGYSEFVAAPGLANGGFVRGYKERGFVSGPGTGTSDSILARLSNGEFVMKANAVKAIGVNNLNAMNNSVPTYANGGYVRGYKDGGKVNDNGGNLGDWAIDYLDYLESLPIFTRRKPNKRDNKFIRAFERGKVGQEELNRFLLATGMPNDAFSIAHSTALNLQNTVIKDLFRANKGRHDIPQMASIDGSTLGDGLTGWVPRGAMGAFVDNAGGASYSPFFNNISFNQSSGSQTASHELGHFLNSKWLGAGTFSKNPYLKDYSTIIKGNQAYGVSGLMEELRAQVWSGFLDRLSGQGSNSQLLPGKGRNIWNLIPTAKFNDKHQSGFEGFLDGLMSLVGGRVEHPNDITGELAYLMGYGHPKQVAKKFGFRLPKGYDVKGLKSFPKLSKIKGHAEGGLIGYKDGGLIEPGGPSIVDIKNLVNSRALKKSGKKAIQDKMMMDWYRYKLATDKDFARSQDIQQSSHYLDDYREWVGTRKQAEAGQYTGWSPLFGNVKKVNLDKGHRAFSKEMLYKQMYSAMGQMGVGGVLGGMVEGFENNPLEMIAEMTGMAGMYRKGKEKLGFQAYSKNAAGDMESDIDTLGIGLSLIPGVGVAGSAIKGGLRGAQLGLRGSSLLTHTLKSGYNTMFTKSLVNSGKFLYGKSRLAALKTPLGKEYLNRKLMSEWSANVTQTPMGKNTNLDISSSSFGPNFTRASSRLYAANRGDHLYDPAMFNQFYTGKYLNPGGGQLLNLPKIKEEIFGKFFLKQMRPVGNNVFRTLEHLKQNPETAKQVFDELGLGWTTNMTEESLTAEQLIKHFETQAAGLDAGVLERAQRTFAHLEKLSSTNKKLPNILHQMYRIKSGSIFDNLENKMYLPPGRQYVPQYKWKFKNGKLKKERIFNLSNDFEKKITMMGIHRSDDSLGNRSLVHPNDVPEQTGRTRGPGTYFALSALDSFSQYRAFGSRLNRPKLSQDALEELENSSGYIAGRDQLNDLIKDFNYQRGKNYRLESGSGAGVHGGLNNLSWDNELVRWLDEDKNFLGYWHGDKNQAFTNWRIGTPGWNLQPTKGIKSAASRISMMTEEQRKSFFKSIIPKFHTGGLVNYAYGKEVMAMLQGGEVVVPKETVRDIQQNSTIDRGVAFNGNINLSFGDKPNIGAYDIQKAIEKGVQEGLKGVQKTSDMMGSRTVIRV